MKAMRKTIRLGTHGEQYGNWMPVSMLSLMGGLLALAAALAALCFAAFHWNVLGVLFTLAALALAVAIESRRRGRGVYRTIFYMPNMISMVIGGYMWMFIFTKVLYYMADNWGMKFLDHSWIGDPRYSFAAIIIVASWATVGYLMIIYMAALQGVPADLIESAQLAGANSRQCFFRVTLPLILPAVTICVFWTLNSGFQVFDVIYALTGGGPGRGQHRHLVGGIPV